MENLPRLVLHDDRRNARYIWPIQQFPMGKFIIKYDIQLFFSFIGPTAYQISSIPGVLESLQLSRLTSVIVSVLVI